MRLSSIEEFVQPDPRPHHQRRRLAGARRPRPGAVHRARAGRPADARLGRGAAGSGSGRRRGVGTSRRRRSTGWRSCSSPADPPSDPKGVMLPHRTVGANLDAIAHATSLDPDDDVLVSWLPLYHDMGLVGLFTLPVTTGTPLVLGAPTDFMGSPSRWMEWISTYGGTATAGPNFSYVLAARALRRSEPLDLSRLRIALNGAEPVDPATVAAFVEAGEPPRPATRGGVPGLRHGRGGHRRHVPEPMSGLRTDPIDLRVLEAERYAAPVDADRHRRSVAGDPRPAGPRARDPRGRSDHRRRAQGARGRRARDPRHLGDARATTSGPTPTPSSSTTAGCAPATSRTCSTARWSCAAASRT